MLSYVTMSACGATEHHAEPVARGKPTLCPAPVAPRLDWGPVACLRRSQGHAGQWQPECWAPRGECRAQALPRQPQGASALCPLAVAWPSVGPGDKERCQWCLPTPSWHRVLLHTLLFLTFSFCFLPLSFYQPVAQQYQ